MVHSKLKEESFINKEHFKSLEGNFMDKRRFRWLGESFINKGHFKLVHSFVDTMGCFGDFGVNSKILDFEENFGVFLILITTL